MVKQILFILRYIFRKSIVFFGHYSRPGFLIVGAQKAGTSALFEILKQHPDITGSHRKEIHFFDHDKNFPRKTYHTYHTYFPFPHLVPKGNLLFEATPSYLYRPGVAKRIFDYNPEIKIIICLREPAARALSAWIMFHYGFKDHAKYSHLYDPRSFNEAIAQELEMLKKNKFGVIRPPYIQTGIYHYQIEEYFKYFPKKNILILEHRELRDCHVETINLICDFLSLPQKHLPKLEKNTSVKATGNDYAEELLVLNEFYKPYNEKLFELIGKRYNW
ncbi:MAG: sulfotransferase [Bacteroidetes bacterium]|jgi:hypothetical protein|nr:sulfotransferase [Bacteroidota bacterium]